MLRITKLSDYAIAVLATVAQAAEPVFSARSAAEWSHLPQPVVKKVLKCLAQHGVVVSQRGTLGGYHLGRPAAQIALADVIEAVEGPFALTDCGQDAQRKGMAGDACKRREHCSIQSNLQRVNAVVRRALASVTVADMIGPGERNLVSLRIQTPRHKSAPIGEGRTL